MSTMIHHQKILSAKVCDLAHCFFKYFCKHLLGNLDSVFCNTALYSQPSHFLVQCI